VVCTISAHGHFSLPVRDSCEAKLRPFGSPPDTLGGQVPGVYRSYHISWIMSVIANRSHDAMECQKMILFMIYLFD
jgi:hypothetical protein